MYKRFAIAVLIAAPLAVMGLDDFHPRKKGEEARDGQPSPTEVAVPAPSPPPANNYNGPLVPLAALPPSKVDPAPATASGAGIAPPSPVVADLIEPAPTGGQTIYED